MNTNPIPRCLVLDDNPDLLTVTSAMLANVADLEICCCNSGADALRTFAAAPDAFQFVITDLDMPEMNGRELCRCLHELAPELKVVLATGSEFVTDKQAKRDGFFRLLHKPFPLESLRTVVNALKEFIAPEAQAVAA